MQHKKIIGILTAVVTAACCGAAETASAAVKAAEKTALSSASSVSVYDEYREWSQLDPRWGDTPMGGTTIRRSGCLITSLAIMAVHSGSIDSAAMANLGISDIEQFNPGVLANAYTSVGGFSGGGAISSWGTIHNLIPNIIWGKDAYLKNTSKEAAADEIKSLMDEGWHVIARVNNGGFHWVYIEDVGTDGSVTMCDPAKDTHDLYEGYPSGFQGEYWALKGTDAPGDSGNFYEYEAALDIEVTSLPNKTIFRCGEELDLTGGTVTLSGVDPKTGEWKDEPVPMTSENISVDASKYDPNILGSYDITVKADMGYAVAEAVFQVIVCSQAEEYFVGEDLLVDVYSEPYGGTVQFSLKKGNVVYIERHNDDYGYVVSESVSGWVDMSQLEKTENHVHMKGDLNDDGIVDKYDLSLLNSYLQQREQLPTGVSTLTFSQLDAADLNGDGVVDLADVREFLTSI